MSDKEQPKKIKPEEDQSENSEGSKKETSPDDAEDKCLLPVPPSDGAEAQPVAGSSGAPSASEGLTSLFRKISPFKSKGTSKTKEPPRKKSKDSKLVKAKKAFRKTFRRSQPVMGTEPETDEIRRRKYSDPTHSRTRIESGTGSEQLPESGQKVETGTKPKKSFFGHFSGSSSKESESKTKEQKIKESKSKEPKAEKEPSSKKESKPKKGFFGHSSEPATKPATSPEYKKKALSPRPSNQPSIGAVSVGFFNEGLLPSESSGNPTESTSLDIKSGSSYSPDAPGSKKPSIKRTRSSKESDEESSSD